MNQTNSTSVKKKEGLFTRMGNFFRGVFVELRKVVWPTKKELINFEVAVIVFSLLSAIAIWIFDLAFRTGITALLKF